MTEKIFELKDGIAQLSDNIFSNLSSIGEMVSADDPEKIDDIMSDIKTTDLSLTSLAQTLDEEIFLLFQRHQIHGRYLRSVTQSLRIIYDILLIEEQILEIARIIYTHREFSQEVVNLRNEWVLTLIKETKQLIYQFNSIYHLVMVGDPEIETQPVVDKTIEIDDKIDDIYDTHLSKLVELVKSNTLTINKSFELSTMIRAFERIGDHLCNMIERSIFVHTNHLITL